MICSNCNTMNADGLKFCGNCGAPLGMAQPGPQTQQAQGQPQMQPGYGQQMQPGYAPPAGNGKGGGGLKAVLIAVCALLAVAVVALALVLTGVIGPKNSDDGKTDVASSEQSTSRSDSKKSGSKKTGTTETTQETDTDDKPEQSSVPEPYRQVLQLFRDALDGKDVTGNVSADDYLSYEFTSCMYDLSYAADMYDEEDGGYGYMLADLDKNGVEELLIGRNEAYTSVHTEAQQTSSSVIAVFTLSDGEDVQAIPVLFGFLRSTYYLTKDNTFAHYGSMGAMDAYAGEWALDHTDIVQQGDGVRVYADFESDDYEAAFYRISPGADLYGFDETNRITEEEYDAYLERLEGKHTAVSFQKIESSYGVEAWTFSPGAGKNDQHASGGGLGAAFDGQYQNMYAGVVSNIWEQSTGRVFTFGIDDASFSADAFYDAGTGRLTFDGAIDYASDTRVSGYAELEGNTLRVTFTDSDNEYIAAGDVYTLDRVE